MTLTTIALLFVLYLLVGCAAAGALSMEHDVWLALPVIVLGWPFVVFFFVGDWIATNLLRRNS
jgi:hypothetical protein